VDKIDKDKNQVYTKKGTKCQRKVLDNQIYSSLTHIIVFQKKQISYLNKISNTNLINIILDSSIDFQELKLQNHSPNQIDQFSFESKCSQSSTSSRAVNSKQKIQKR